MLSVLVFLSPVVMADLNGTALANTISEAFIAVGGLIDGIVGIIPDLVTLGIYMAILTAIVGLFGAVVVLVKKAFGKAT